MESLTRILPLCHCAFNAFLVSERVPRLESRACQTSGPRAAAAVVNNRGSSSSRTVGWRKVTGRSGACTSRQVTSKLFSVAVDFSFYYFVCGSFFGVSAPGWSEGRTTCLFFRRPWLAKFQASGLSDQLLLCWSRRSSASKLLYARGVYPGPELLLLLLRCLLRLSIRFAG